MGRNNRNNTPLALVIKAINTIILIIGYCVVINGLLNGTLITDSMYYANMIIQCLTILTTGT